MVLADVENVYYSLGSGMVLADVGQSISFLRSWHGCGRCGQRMLFLRVWLGCGRCGKRMLSFRFWPGCGPKPGEHQRPGVPREGPRGRSRSVPQTPAGDMHPTLFSHRGNGTRLSLHRGGVCEAHRISFGGTPTGGNWAERSRVVAHGARRARGERATTGGAAQVEGTPNRVRGRTK